MKTLVGARQFYRVQKTETKMKTLNKISEFFFNFFLIFFLGGGKFWGAGAAPPPTFDCPGVSGTVKLHQRLNSSENLFIAI